jgi:hypothetical protein
MSNKFKSNSRFSALMEDIPIKDKKETKKEEEKNIIEDKNEPKVNSFKNDGFRENSFNSDRRHDNRYRPIDEKERKRLAEERAATEKTKLELKEKEKHRLRDEALQENNFPELFISKKKKEVKANILNYAEKIIKEDEIVLDIKGQDDNYIKPGWISIRKDKQTGKIIREGNTEYEKKTIYNRQSAQNVLNALANLHEKRTREYIDNYDYDTWENMFRFQDYDYNYFDILDEEYKEMIENLVSDNNNNDDDEYEY